MNNLKPAEVAYLRLAIFPESFRTNLYKCLSKALEMVAWSFRA